MCYPVGYIIYPNSCLNLVLSYWYLALFISMIVSIIAYLLYDSLSVLLALCLMLNPIGLLQFYPHLLAAALSHWLSPVISHWFSLHILSHWFSPVQPVGSFLVYSIGFLLSYPIGSLQILSHWLSFVQPIRSLLLYPIGFFLHFPISSFLFGSTF